MTTATTERSTEIAETIISQLGGYSRLGAMTGAKGYTYGTDDSGETHIEFRIGRNSNQINVVQITLNSNDTYTMKFFWSTVKKVTEKWSFHGVYADSLIGIFESATGMYLSL